MAPRVAHYNCPICEERVSSLNFQKHLESHAHKKFQCKICNKLFSSKQSCGRHEKLHTEAKPQQQALKKYCLCADCENPDKPSTTKARGRKHKIHHQSNHVEENVADVVPALVTPSTLMEKDEEQMPMTQVGDEKEALDIAEEKRPENANMKITFEMFGQKFYAVNGQPNDEPWKIALI